MDRRLSRRKLALSAGALALAIPGLAACGFNYATDRANTIAAGATDQSGEVDVLNAVVVSDAAGSGTFVASVSNNSATKPIMLETLAFGSSSTVQVAAFAPIEIKPQQLVNLADGQGIKVAGDFEAGDFVRLSVGFDDGHTSDLNVPVVAADDEWTGLDNGTGVPSPSATASNDVSPTAAAS